ncbi:MAG: MFS transporter [Gemmatimonadales bacterium]
MLAKRSRWLSPGVLGIGAASFLSDVGHEVPTSLLPGFLSGLGAPAAALGLIEGTANGVAGLARLAGGALADDPARRRRVALGGYASTAILSALIGVAPNAWQVGLLRTGAWAARGVRGPARNALLAEVVPAEVYGRAYGFERTMDNLGAIAGPLLALALVAAVGVRQAMLISVFPGLLAALAILYAIRRSPPVILPARVPVRLVVRPLLQGGLGRLIAAIAAFEMGNVAATLLILRSTQVFAVTHSAAGATQLGLTLYMGYNAAAAVISIPAGRLSDRFGSAPVLVGGATLSLIAYSAFALGGEAAIVSGFLAAGLGVGCVETAQHAAVASLAPDRLRGSAFGLLAAAQSIANFAASSIAGLLWTLVSPMMAFGYLAVWAMVALVGFVLVGRGAGSLDLAAKTKAGGGD